MKKTSETATPANAAEHALGGSEREPLEAVASGKSETMGEDLEVAANPGARDEEKIRSRGHLPSVCRATRTWPVLDRQLARNECRVILRRDGYLKGERFACDGHLPENGFVSNLACAHGFLDLASVGMTQTNDLPW